MCILLFYTTVGGCHPLQELNFRQTERYKLLCLYSKYTEPIDAIDLSTRTKSSRVLSLRPHALLQLNYPQRSPSYTFLLYMYSLVSNFRSSMRNLQVSEFSGGRCPITSWVMSASIQQFLGLSNTTKKSIRHKSVTIRIWNWQRNNSSCVFMPFLFTLKYRRFHQILQYHICYR